MKRSARPLQSGSSTKDGASVKPQHLISFTKVFAVYCGPPSWRRATPSATVGAIHPEGRRHPLADRFQGRPPIADLRDVPAHDLGRVVM
jgi:hypothetical protein